MHHEVMIAKGKDGASYLTHLSVNGTDYCDESIATTAHDTHVDSEWLRTVVGNLRLHS
jgi:hypothetical protein